MFKYDIFLYILYGNYPNYPLTFSKISELPLKKGQLRYIFIIYFLLNKLIAIFRNSFNIKIKLVIFLFKYKKSKLKTLKLIKILFIKIVDFFIKTFIFKS